MHVAPSLAALVLAPAILFGQLSSNTVTVTASRAPNTTLDQAVFSIIVESGVDQSLDDVLRALASSGFTSAMLVAINKPALQLPRQTARIDWTFRLIVPLANVKTTTASLASLQKSIQQNTNDLSLSFTLQNAQSSTSPSQNCDWGGLIADARSQAQNISGAAGLTATAIVGLQGAISQPAVNCSLTVTFALGYSGHPGPNAITITASRTQNVQPDQVVIGISVNSDMNVGPDDINGALTAAGITGTSFSGVTAQSSYSGLAGMATQYLVQWSYTLTVPLAKLKDTLAQIAVAQQALSKQTPALALTSYIQYLQVSPQAQPVCRQADLVSDATAQAQTIATAGGKSAGAILNLSNTSPYSAISSAIYDPISSVTVGNFAYASFLLGFVIGPSATTPCSVSVQFQLY